MNYEPNWANQKVRRRVEKVLNWASKYMLGKHGRTVPVNLAAKGFTDEHGNKVPGLNDIFGPKGNELGDYLRARLLMTHSRSYTPGKKSMSYLIARDGYDEIQRAVGRHVYGDTSVLANTRSIPGPEPYERVIQRHAEELHTLTFQYKDSSDRLWHPLQNLPKERKNGYTGPTKHEFWKNFGLPFDYDIVACAPTILFQLARRTGVPEVVLEGLKTFLDDRTGFRQHVANLTGLSLADAKTLVNSMFNGAKLGKNPFWSSFKLVEFDHDAMDRLTNDAQIQRLKASIARVWKRIEAQRRADTLPALSEILEGREQKDWKLGNSKKKWGVYFEQERAVLNSISAYLSEHGIRHFTEHDGFRTERQIDLAGLRAKILADTGLDLEIEQKEESPSVRAECTATAYGDTRLGDHSGARDLYGDTRGEIARECDVVQGQDQRPCRGP